MTQAEVIPAGQGPNYDWSNDHIFVKTAQALTQGRVTVVEDTLKPGFHLARHHHCVMVEIFYILASEVEFNFDGETIHARPGMTINIPTNTWHAVSCPLGGKLITVFSPGGFDDYLKEIAALSPAQWADEALMTALAEQYDTWLR